MITYVVLLRAINVGGRNKIPMAELRELLGEAGFESVATYIQSGNVVCSSALDTAAVAATIHQAIVDRFGHDVAVIVRTTAELDAIVAGFPYAGVDPKQSGVVFLSGAVEGHLDAQSFAPDECVVSGADVYVHLPTSFGKTKLTAAWIEKQTGLAGTRRNWATVLKLADMVAAV